MIRFALKAICLLSLIVLPVAAAEIDTVLEDPFDRMMEGWRLDGIAPDLEIVAEVFDDLASSTQIEHARKNYLQILRELDGGMAWIEDEKARSLFIRWLENAQEIAEAADDLWWINYRLARMLENNAAQEFDPERWIKTYQTAISFHNLKTQEKWDAMMRLAGLLARYGHQQFDNQGELNRSPDYAAAVVLYRELLSDDWGIEDEKLEPVKKMLDNIEEPRLEWLSHRSFFPDTEMQLTLRSQNLDQVQVEVFRLSGIDDIEMAESGGGGVSASALTVGPVELFSFVPNPPSPYYPSLNHWDIGVQPPGIYWLRAQSGELVESSFVLVTDLALLAHYSESGLYLQGIDADTGAPLESLDWRIIGQNSRGEPIDENGQLRGTIFDKLDVDLANSQSFILLAELGQMAAILFGKAVGMAEQPMEWVVETSQPTARFDEEIHWIAYPDGELNISLAPIDWSKPVLTHWRAPDGKIIQSQQHEIDRYKTLQGNFTPDAAHAEGIYSVRIDATTSTGDPAISMEIPVIYVGKSLSRPITIKYSHDISASSEILPIWVLDHQHIRENLLLQTSAGNPVVGAAVTISLCPVEGIIPILKRSDLQSDSEGRVVVDWDLSLAELTPGIYRMETQIQLAESRISGPDRYVEVREHSLNPEIRLNQQLFRPGDVVQLSLELDAIKELEDPVAGLLMVHRDQWQRTYIHRKRGSEISEEFWLELPERSLLGRSQSDYRIGAEGFHTEEIHRIETNMGNGVAVFNIPAAEEGFYRASWVGFGLSAQSAQVETEFRVFHPGSLRRSSSSPELNIILDRSPLSESTSNRLLLSSPHSDASIFFTGGIQGPEVRQFNHSQSGDVLIDFDLAEAPSRWAWLELNAFHQGDWLSKSMLAPISRSANLLVVDAELPVRNFQPGEQLTVDVWVSDLSGQPVEAQVRVHVSPRKGVNIGSAFDQFRQNQLASMPMPWMTWSSVNTYPFKDDSAHSHTSVLAHTAYSTNEARFFAQWQNYRNQHLEPTIWLPSSYTDAEGHCELVFSLPEVSSEWVIRIQVVDSDQRKGQFKQTVSTYSAIELDWSAPEFVYVGDEIKEPVQIKNLSGHQIEGIVRFKLSDESSLIWDYEWDVDLDSGEMLSLPVLITAGDSEKYLAQIHFERSSEQNQWQQSFEILNSRFIGPFWDLESEGVAKGNILQSTEVMGLRELLEFSLDYSPTEATSNLKKRVSRLYRDDYLADSIFSRYPTKTESIDWSFLIEYQNDDGGWSRPPDAKSDPWLSAMILWMISESVDDREIELVDLAVRAHGYLVNSLINHPDDTLLVAWILHANTYYQAKFGDGRLDRLEARAYLRLMREARELGFEGQSLLLIVSLIQQFEEEAGLLFMQLQDAILNDRIHWSTTSHRFGTLFPLLSLRAILLAHPDWDGSKVLAQNLPKALVFHHQDELCTLLAQVVTIEYLMTRPNVRGESEDAYRLSLRKHPLLATDKGALAELKIRRKILMPTLLKGFVEREELWDPDMTMHQGDVLEIEIQLAFEKATDIKRIRLRAPSGSVSGNGISSISWLSDEVTHQIYNSKFHTDIIFQSHEPGQVNLRYSLRLDTAGIYRIPALLIYSGRSLIPEVITEDIRVNVNYELH